MLILNFKVVNVGIGTKNMDTEHIQVCIDDWEEEGFNVHQKAAMLHK